MTIYMQYTDKQGQKMIQSHQVWDKAHFIECQVAHWAKEGGSANETTQETYRAACWPRK